MTKGILGFFTKPTGRDKITLEASVGEWNFNNGNFWEAIDLGLVPSDDPDNFSWMLWRARYKMYLNFDGRMRLYPWYWVRPDDYVEFESPDIIKAIGAGALNTTPGVNALDWTSPDFTARRGWNGHKIWFDVDFKDAPKFNSISFPMAKVGITDKELGELLAMKLVELDTAGEVKDEGIERGVDYTIKGDSLDVTFDASGMERVRFDPTIEVSPVVSADDISHTPAHGMHIDTSLVLGNVSGGYGSYVRYIDVTVPKDSTVDVAHQIFHSSNNRSANTVNVTQVGYLIPDAPQITNDTEWHVGVDDNPTVATVDWDAVPAFVADMDYQAPSCIAICEEIFAQGSWASGNALGMFTNDNGSSSNAFRQPWAVEGPGLARAAILHIEYTAAAAAGGVGHRRSMLTLMSTI